MEIRQEWLQQNGLYKCPYCEKEISKYGIKNHLRLKHTDAGQEYCRKLYKTRNLGKTTWNKGLKLSEEHKQNISNGMKSSSKVTGMCKDPESEKQRREKISKNGKGKIGGYRKGSGRGKSGWYQNYWCDSSWELAFIIYNLEHNIKFERNKKYFEYEFNGEQHKYYPDFIMENGTYIEIKGYETEQTFKKYEVCPNLKIYKYPEMKVYLDYVINKYGEDFIKLYNK